MKTLAIITYTEGAANRYCSELEVLFKNKLSIKKYYVVDGNLSEGVQADLVLISTYDVYKITKKYIPDNIQIINTNLTILKSNFQKILDLPAGSKALLVNFSLSLALQCIDQIYQLGAKHIELIPYSPNLEETNGLELAITPDEEKLVPASVKHIINIGNRVIDISTIVYILIHFELEDLFYSPEVKDYYKKIMPLNFSSGLDMIQSYFCLNEFITMNYRSGIISFTQSGIITNYNPMAEKILGFKGESIIGENVLRLFPQPSIQEAIKKMRPLEKKQIKIKGDDILVKITTGETNVTSLCYITLERVHESTIKTTSFKKVSIASGYVAKYYFSDIITEDEHMKRVIQISEMNAKTHSSVLITGESGTGKELFAQAIHNASNREGNPFVAINCAAVPESLLESELFGYEEGAFTGARRGGKKGLFELAHSGTLFLDEIGEMPIGLQARLLRVLQEKEIIRIGGDRVIGVDVRIIAATNRRIDYLIKNNQFRLDLYYRLNVIPLKIPPLRDRKKDIPLLVDTFTKQLNANFQITDSAMKRLKNHYWEGNIRELRNYIEYFRNLCKPVIDIEDLPVLSEVEVIDTFLNKEEKENILKFEQYEKDKISDIIFILEALKNAEDSNRRLGRRSLAELSRIKRKHISEVEIRNLLFDMEAFQMVKILKGRGGTVITELGLKALEAIKSKAKD
ncbi:propionate catabolism operon regulatory protein [Clostridium homopropionicum DSM 5847]|uniref:Propionate catabolism operon regulatory protein n=1 Tax=Clostridium homopropionicum DSM 5847 TaxID=1121318 RepID=A0A0L6ZD07_9CLOT|nr:sigma 54-interacting transcriptional regulator [Clostridium homopropionicum]KOA20832.1 propionate catabolism operon regulatory protein [Clostridium homopropionicum DSM 5847]SFF87988.1 PAS domain S-box-containing protein [Clostridium homopropionicum]